MELLLCTTCQSISGSLGKNLGYHIEPRKNKHGKTRFFGRRNTRGSVPEGGHLRFIFACLELTRTHLHLSDVRISAAELHNALMDANCFQAAQNVWRHLVEGTHPFYNAADLQNLKTTFSL